MYTVSSPTPLPLEETTITLSYINFIASHLPSSSPWRISHLSLPSPEGIIPDLYTPIWSEHLLEWTQTTVEPATIWPSIIFRHSPDCINVEPVTVSSEVSHFLSSHFEYWERDCPAKQDWSDTLTCILGRAGATVHMKGKTCLDTKYVRYPDGETRLVLSMMEWRTDIIVSPGPA